MHEAVKHIICCLLLVLVHGIAKAQGTIMTVAGTGTYGFSGDGGDGRYAEVSQLCSISWICFDPEGNIFFSDLGNYRIRRIDRKTNIITTFAGNGGRGATGDGGLATAAEINSPRTMSFDWKGNLLFLDSLNCRIRSISPSGIINYYGGSSCGYFGDGGLLTSAGIEYGSRILGGDSGKLVIGSSYYIRLVNTSRVINKIAGTTPGYAGDGGLAIYAQMHEAMSLAFDLNRQLTFIDGNVSRRVRHINSKGIINTLAGNGSGIPSGDGSKAFMASLGNTYGLAYDQFGNMFIAAGSYIRRVDARDSIITTIAGTGTIGYSGEGVDAKTSSIAGAYIFFDTSHYELYFGEPGRIRKITNIVKPVAIPEANKTYTPELYPNPATTSITLSGVPLRAEISLYDLMGREVLHTQMSNMETGIDMHALPPGAYILRATAPNGNISFAKCMKL